MENIVDQNIWDESYENFQYYIADDIITRKMDELIAEKGIELENKSCLEIGCFPCRYLTHFGKKYSMTINGVDRTNHLNTAFFDWLQTTGCHIGTIKCQDFFNFIEESVKNQQQFDLVYSVGFIEHFKDYLDVIDAHCKALKPGGILILECPNFKGKVQYFLHRILDNKNLSRHVVESMDPFKWEIFLKEKDYEILCKEYFGGFRFWYGVQHRNIFMKALCKFCLYISNLLCKIVRRNSPQYSPYCILMARKPYC